MVLQITVKFSCMLFSKSSRLRGNYHHRFNLQEWMSLKRFCLLQKSSVINNGNALCEIYIKKYWHWSLQFWDFLSLWFPVRILANRYEPFMIVGSPLGFGQRRIIWSDSIPPNRVDPDNLVGHMEREDILCKPFMTIWPNIFSLSCDGVVVIWILSKVGINAYHRHVFKNKGQSKT